MQTTINANTADQFETVGRLYDQVEETFRNLLNDIRNLRGEQRHNAFEAAYAALNDNHSATTQMRAMADVRTKYLS